MIVTRFSYPQISELAFAPSCGHPDHILQIRQVVFYLVLCELPESWADGSFDTLVAEQMIRRFAHDADFDGIAVHFSFDGFLQRQERDVYGILRKMSAACPSISPRAFLTSNSSESLYRFSKNVFALVALLPIAVAFHGK